MLQMLSVVDPRFILMVLLGSVAGLFVGAIPGLSVSMATAPVSYTHLDRRPGGDPVPCV